MDAASFTSPLCSLIWANVLVSLARSISTYIYKIIDTYKYLITSWQRELIQVIRNWYINNLRTLDLSSSDSTQCVDESEFDRQISHGINISIAFLHHLSNSLHRKNMIFYDLTSIMNYKTSFNQLFSFSTCLSWLLLLDSSMTFSFNASQSLAS